ncbi:sensor histidine kinase [Lentisalinibacter salinarum]|uniref:sensor histidine kinase n=1 Tax=Lentisalinibacter salinarum TaxID=2992239 RepID=UPI00386787DB
MVNTLVIDNAEGGPDKDSWLARRPAILAVCLLGVGLCLAVLLARAEINAERQRWAAGAELWAENLGRAITLTVREDIGMLRRMAARLSAEGIGNGDAWRRDAGLYMAHEESYVALAIIDAEQRVMQMVTDEKTSEAEVIDWQRHLETPDSRVGEFHLGTVVNRAAGVDVLPGWITVDTASYGPVRLFAAWDVDRIVEGARSAASFRLDEFNLEIRIDGRTVNASAGSDAGERRLAGTAEIRSDIETAHAIVWPAEPVGIPSRAWLTAAGVGLISLLFSFAGYTAWRALSDRERLAANEAELRRQVVARTEAEQRLRLLADRLDAEVSERTKDLEETAERLRESRAEALRLMESARRTGRLAEQHAIDLARSNQNLELFMRVASHDMKEPLRMVRSYADLLHQRYGDQLDETAREFLGYAREGAERMQRMLRDVLMLCRIQLDSLDVPVADSERCLDDACANLSLLIGETGAAVHRESLMPVRAEPNLLTLLFQNLIANAIKFRGEDSPVIVINMHAEDEWVRTEVADNGIGIAPHYHARVFEPFQRLQSRDERDGSGVGLAICKRIVEWHGGFIGIESDEGNGTTIWFTLPRDDGDHDPLRKG